ncbi:5-formyltetrahydrofolate cyclo-ligase [Paenibacillus sp. BIHB 4019]|uniref:5-formyltetrahydrofolate cyclo-ligase n=1 Tax=Paenibacillus sp. BIHB 4019 TaxID=1870819 RepID=A0A1B2DIL1_9BACL|nr:5-formyltetrahydrofolate cyclo-ligase [Paenibacillus sp. BIHB 4019]ANY67536.1 5-formyltetrahydrofolate cyclo-ligase [Paenibacillus sp. BIHB 4019]
MADNEKSQIKAEKQRIRADAAKVRDRLSKQDRALWSGLACGALSKWLEGHPEQREIMCYVPFRSELDLWPLMDWLWSTGREVIVPRCHPLDRSMTLYRLQSPADLMEGAYGISEPDPAKCEELPQGHVPDSIIVPGIRFDRKGGRMGYGGGYYDRFAERASQAGKRAIWIGAAFEAQVAEQVPMQEHDLKMNGIVTESGIHFI